MSAKPLRTASPRSVTSFGEGDFVGLFSASWRCTWNYTNTASIMHSTLVRVQNVFGFFTSVAFAVAAAIAVSVLLSPQNPSASLELKNVRV